jgi:hypothetical protein
MIVLWLLLRVCLAFRECGRLKQRARPLNATHVRRLDAMRIALGVRRRVDFRMSDDTATPALVGFVSPVVVIPSREIGADLDEELVLAATHELAHAARRDDWFSLVEHICRAVLFFNPAVRWLFTRTCLAREMACDEWVVARSQVEPARYAETLLRTAERARAGRRLPALASAATGSSLGSRVRWLVSPEFACGRPGRLRWLGSAAFVAAATLIIAASPLFGVHVSRATPDIGAGARLVAVADALERAGRSGAVLVAVNGETLVHRGFGVSNRETGTPATAPTHFNVGALAARSRLRQSQRHPRRDCGHDGHLTPCEVAHIRSWPDGVGYRHPAQHAAGSDWRRRSP